MLKNVSTAVWEVIRKGLLTHRKPQHPRRNSGTMIKAKRPLNYVFNGGNSNVQKAQNVQTTFSQAVFKDGTKGTPS